MPRINLSVQPELYEHILRHKPKSLTVPAFCGLLVEQMLDKGDMLGGPSAAGTPSNTLTSNTYVLEDKKGEFSETTSIPKRKGGRPSSSETKHLSAAFLSFWSTYQACDLKAHGQSRKKAWEAWQAAIKQESPERLLEAARRAVGEVRRLSAAGMFCAPLPDAFRWLRDERYAVFLDDKPAKDKSAPFQPSLRNEYAPTPAHNPYEQRRPDGTIYAQRPDGSTVELGTVEERERQSALSKLRARAEFPGQFPLAARASAVCRDGTAQSDQAAA